MAATLLKNTQKIINYLEKNIGYKIRQFVIIESIGATDCKYLAITLHNNKKLFVKTGEKVGLEVRNINYLTKQGVDSIPTLLKGTNKQMGVLIEELLPQPMAGYNAVKNLHDKKISARQFLNFQRDSFSVLRKFYAIPIGKKEIYKSSTFLEKTSRSLKKLHTEKIFFMNNNSKIYLHKILDTQITYIKNGQEVELPSVMEMFNGFKNKISSMPIIIERVVHGDFHAPNIIKTLSGKIRIVDISDVHYQEDPCWDLGKWLNYVKRFYRVSNIRTSRKIDSTIKISCHANRFFISDNYTPTIKIKTIHDDAINVFSKIIDSNNKNLIELRAAAAEFMVNVYTLRRHVKRHPNTVKSILSCICDSYIQFIKILS